VFNIVALKRNLPLCGLVQQGAAPEQFAGAHCQQVSFYVSSQKYKREIICKRKS